MKEGEDVFFAPDYNIKKMYEEVLFNPEELINAFNKRVFSYYIDPARKLPAFAQGILCCSLIDFLAKLRITDLEQVNDYREFYNNNFKVNPFRKPAKIYMGERIVSFLVYDLKIFSLEEAYWFCEYVRNGLIHEGRVKCGCYLDTCIESPIEEENGALLFNPNLILKELESWFKVYINTLKKEDTYEKFFEYIKKIIDEDLSAINIRSQGNKFPCRNIRGK